MLNNKMFLLIVALAIIAIASILDIFNDLQQNVTTVHLFEEAVVIMASLGLMTFLVYLLLRQSNQLESLKQDLDNRQHLLENQCDEMRTARSEYSQIIKQQFANWNFSETEKTTAHLLLKGLSLKEIAEIRGIKEKTVRQQASNLYSKANLPGRHALAAWFFEDLL